MHIDCGKCALHENTRAGVLRGYWCRGEQNSIVWIPVAVRVTPYCYEGGPPVPREYIPPGHLNRGYSLETWNSVELVEENPQVGCSWRRAKADIIARGAILHRVDYISSGFT